MQLVVHGTKDGYRILYTTDHDLSLIISRDIRKGAQGDEQLGKTAYSLAFVKNGCVYSKYVIVKDSIRSFATGTIAFSVFLSADETINAEQIFKLLNELYNSYETLYIRNYYLNRGQIELIREDWPLIKDIFNKYKTTPNTNRHENINSGTKDPALIYYQDNKELLDYFDKPFQPEYADYSQILFIHSNLNGSVSPINVLKNSGKSLEIDLKNEPYYLNDYKFTPGLTIEANDRELSNGKNNNSFRAKEMVIIKFMKDYHVPFVKAGRLSDPASEIIKYLEIRGSQISIKYNLITEEIKPLEKRININVIDWKNKNSIEADEIICRIGNDRKQLINNQFIFQGQEIAQTWFISAIKGNDLFSDEKSVIPENISGVELVLNKYKKVKFQGEIETENGIKSFPDIKISINKKNIIKEQNSEVEFINEELNQQFEVIAYYSFNNLELFGQKTFYPNDIEEKNSISIQLKQQAPPKKESTYFIDLGKYGSADAEYSQKADGSDIKVKTKTKQYIFVGFKLDETKKKEGSNGTLVAQYKKKEYFYDSPKFFIGLIIVFFVIIGFIWFDDYVIRENLDNSPKMPQEASQSDQLQQTTIQYKKDYIEGNLIILDTLTLYKVNLSSESNDYNNSLDSAIKKREAINSWNFSELKKLSYTQNQNKFFSAIRNIDSAKYYIIKNKLGNVSSWSLDRIADSINFVLEEINHSKGYKSGSNKDLNELKKDESKKNVIQPVRTERNIEEKLDLTPANGNLQKNSIIEKLKSETVTRNELKNFYNAEMVKKNKSIDLYLKFWDLLLEGNIQYYAFNKLWKEVKIDPVLKSSKLNDFLNLICKDSKTFGDTFQNKVNKVPKNPTLTLIKLKGELSIK
jgi:hypothetical protein